MSLTIFTGLGVTVTEVPVTRNRPNVDYGWWTVQSKWLHDTVNCTDCVSAVGLITVWGSGGMRWTGKNVCVLVPLHAPQVLHGLSCNSTWAHMVRGKRLTIWVTARSCLNELTLVKLTILSAAQTVTCWVEGCLMHSMLECKWKDACSPLYNLQNILYFTSYYMWIRHYLLFKFTNNYGHTGKKSKT